MVSDVHHQPGSNWLQELDEKGNHEKRPQLEPALPHTFFAFTDIDNIALFNRILSPCFGEAEFLAKQRGNPDMNELPAMQGFESLVEDSRAQQQRGVQLFSRKGFAASLCEPPDHDNFKVIQLT